MKLLVLGFLLSAFYFSGPAYAADAKEKTADARAVEQTEDSDKAKAAEKEKAAEIAKGEFACKYYKVKLPDGWTAIMPPTDQLGTVNAIFATTTGSSVVTMIVGPNGGADLRTISDMFAEQFKAPKPPALKNGQYVFSFPLQNGNAQAIVSAMGEEFMVTTIAGGLSAAQTFLKTAVSSEEWGALLPK